MTKHHIVDEKERGDYEALLSESEESTQQPLQRSRGRGTKVVCLVLSHLLLASAGLFVGRILLLSPENVCSHLVSQYCKSFASKAVWVGPNSSISPGSKGCRRQMVPTDV